MTQEQVEADSGESNNAGCDSDIHMHKAVRYAIQQTDSVMCWRDSNLRTLQEETNRFYF